MTDVYTAKAALFDRLVTEQAAGKFPDVDEISYDEPSGEGMIAMYMGGVRFTDEDAVPYPGLKVIETAQISVYIRVMQRPRTSDGVRACDAKAQVIGKTLQGVLFQNPTLTGDMKILGIERGQGDYANTDDENISYLAYGVKIQSMYSNMPGQQPPNGD